MEQNIQQQPPVLNNQDLNNTRPEGTALPRLTFKEAVSNCISNYSTFYGRSRRSEYWWFYLFGTILLLIPIVGIIITSFANGKEFPEDYSIGGAIIVAACVIVILLMMLFLLIPSLSVTTRRLHDVGRSGWWLVVYYVCYFVIRVVEGFVGDKFYTDELSSISGFFDAIVNAFRVAPVESSLIALLNLLYIGLAITIFVFTLLDSEKGENQYGPSPKYQ